MNRSIGTLTCILLAVASLAGCVGGEDGDKAGPRSSASAPVDPASSLGRLAAIVTDDELRPLSRAEVGLRGTSHSGFTDDSGRIEFTDVEPGKYTVDVAKLGYEPLARVAEVRAGEATTVDFRLAAITADSAGYYVVSHFTGYYECALGAVLWVSACTYPYTALYYSLHDNGVNLTQYGAPNDLQKNEFRYNFTVEPGAVDVVSEMEWQASSAAATRLQLILSCGNYDPVADTCGNLVAAPPSYAEAEGKSPLRVEWKAAKAGTLPAWVMARGYLPFFDPQLALNQKFEIWNTIFYNQPAPEGFSLVGGNA